MKLCDVITPLTEKGRLLELEVFINYFDQSQRSKKELVSFNSRRTETKTEKPTNRISLKITKEKNLKRSFVVQFS